MRGAWLLPLLLAAAPAAAEEAWMPDWRIEGVLCRGCDPEARRFVEAQRGGTIRFTPGRFDNPLYESCAGGVDYGDIRRLPRAEAVALFRPQWPAPRIAGGSVAAGFVRCRLADGQLNRLGRFVFDGDRGWYLFEGRVVVTLR